MPCAPPEPLHDHLQCNRVAHGVHPIPPLCAAFAFLETLTCTLNRVIHRCYQRHQGAHSSASGAGRDGRPASGTSTPSADPHRVHPILTRTPCHRYAGSRWQSSVSGRSSRPLVVRSPGLIVRVGTLPEPNSTPSNACRHPYADRFCAASCALFWPLRAAATTERPQSGHCSTIPANFEAGQLLAYSGGHARSVRAKKTRC